MSKNTRRAAMPVLIMLLVAVLTLTGVTYAWFSQSNAVTLDTLDLSVESADGILASWDAVDWRTSLNFADDTDKQVPTKCYPVSTAGNVTSGVASFFKGTINSEGKLYAEANPAGNTAGYAMFDIYFKVEYATKLFLRADSFVNVDNGARTDLAVRVGFVNQGVETGDRMTAENAIALAGGSSMEIWEPNAKEHTVAGVAYGGTANGTKVPSYYGINQAIEATSAINPKAENASLTSVTTKELADLLPKSTGGDSVVSLEAGFNKVTVYIWFEGQDQDCLNDVSNNTIHVNLRFARLVAGITGVTITAPGGATTIATDDGTLQLTAAITGGDATNANDFVWEITEGSTLATINGNGLVTAIADGTVTVTATSMYDATKSETFTIDISNQS